ncbi:uncharacterized protein K441DRAFT_685762 [Cenococcum geophilum 1.58]|uniref:uncharacterized protein n=1 Tax=Cenococcum geophilum 1.58 TaxID=794803 RepID=UPI0035900BA3|nr:hypothetical protein K441DRAFT_685762 [Cenococcum geophilum 1.58]
MSNISQPDYADVKSEKSMVWDLFDEFYASWSAGMKPDMGFYKLDSLRDDNLGNVLVGRSLGITSVLKNTESCARMLRNLFGNPLLRGERFLVENARRLESITAVAFKEHCGKDTWNYFAEGLKHGPKTFPDDVDTTSVAMLKLNLGLETIESATDKMLRNDNQNVIIKVYFDDSTAVIDPKSMNWITDMLIHRANVDGTKRSVHPGFFLYFLSCICASLREDLEVGLRERIGLAGDSLSIAIRTLACQALGVDSRVDVNILLGSRGNDGSWEPGSLSRYDTTGTLIGNWGATTAFAIKAIAGT